MRFRVGDVVVLVKARMPESQIEIGSEFTVVEVGPFNGGRSAYNGKLNLEGEYVIANRNGCGVVYDFQLAPKRPPAFERGSWDEI
jgi:hypothetical protein